MGATITRIIETPLGAVLMLVITLVLAGLSVASAISGQLTAAAVKWFRDLAKFPHPFTSSPDHSVECSRAVRDRVDHCNGKPGREGLISIFSLEQALG